MTVEALPKGPWINRFATWVMTGVLAILIFWLLGFVLQDVKSIRGPDYQDFEAQHIDSELVTRLEQREEALQALNRRIEILKEDQRLVDDRSKNLQTTLDQLLALQNRRLEKDLALSETEQQNISASLNQFLEDQKTYQDLSRSISDSTSEKNALQAEIADLEKNLARQREPARKAYGEALEKHRLKLATLQLAILVPVLLVGVVLYLKKRTSVYVPFIQAFGAATLLKVGLVMHEYFPARIFKYILIAALILVVGRLLLHLIRVVAFPRSQWLSRQYREAYERFLCPVCEYPIRLGPRRFQFWTRRSVKNPPVSGDTPDEEPYTCPSCGTALFQACAECRKIRHSLLDHCQHCGALKDA